MNKFRINLKDGAGYNGPYINKFSSGFDSIKFYVDKSFPDSCTYAVIYSVCGDVGMSTDSDSNVAVSADPDTGKTLVTWTLGREVTCDSGVVIYQVVVYNSDEDGNGAAVWYSPQGRIVVGESIDTTDYETAVIAAEPSLVSQLISKTNKLSKDSSDHLRRIDILEQLQQAAERRADEMYDELSRDIETSASKLAELDKDLAGVTEGLGDALEKISVNTADIANFSESMTNVDGEFSEHKENSVIHMRADERNRAEKFFSLYDANGLLSLSAEEAEETNALLAEVVSVPGNLHIAFMNGAHSLETAPYNKLKLLSSYGICDYIVNGGGFAPKGKELSAADVLDISRAAGTGSLTVRGDNTPGADIWGNVFCGGDKSYYYIDDLKKNIRIVVLDTENMDNAQIHWFVKDALRPGINVPVIIFSYRNLGDFIMKSDATPLFARIFESAQTGTVLTLADDVMRENTVVCHAEVSTKFDASVGILAAVHGNCGVDICKNDLSENFCNLGVAEDMADEEARSLFEKCETDIHADVSKVSELSAVVRADASDVNLDGIDAIKVKPTTNDNEIYIVPDVYDIRNVDGYVVIETSVRLGKNIPDNALFIMTTNQSRAISKSIYFGDLAATANADGWVRIMVVICMKPGDKDYGFYYTYANGANLFGRYKGSLGEMMDDGKVRSEIRLVAKNLTTESVLYFGRSCVYVCDAKPGEDMLKNGLGDSTFCYGGEVYNSGCEQAVLQKLGGDKGCYDILCIDTELQKIRCCRFGFGVSRDIGWIVPDVAFE